MRINFGVIVRLFRRLGNLIAVLCRVPGMTSIRFSSEMVPSNAGLSLAG